MSKRLVIILWAVAGILAAITISVKYSQSRATEKTTALSRGEELLKPLNLDKVAKVTFNDGESGSTLTKGEDGWTLAERSYPANFEKLLENLSTLKEATIAQEGMKAGTVYNERFGMDPEGKTGEDHGIVITFFDTSGKELEKVSIGKSVSSGGPMGGGSGGRYVRLASEPGAVYVINEDLNNLSAVPTDWLKPGFISVVGAKTITLAPQGETEAKGWTATRESISADFTLQDVPEGREPAATTLTSMKTALGSGRFNDVLTEEEAMAKREEAKARTLEISTFEGFHYTIDYAPAKIEVPENLEEGTVTPASSDSYIVKVSVDADLATEREKTEGETEEQAKAAQENFNARQAELKKKLAREKALEGHWYSVPKSILDPINKSFEEIAPAVAKTDAQAPVMTNPSIGPVEAVTPPIAIPPLDGNGAPTGDAQTLSEEEIRRIIEENARQNQSGE